MNELDWQLLEDNKNVDHLMIGTVEVRVGDRVCLRPRNGGDILDIALKGQVATVESIEEDYEGKSHLAVVLDEDPGRDLGLLRQPGHRFFFDPSEIEPLPGDQQPQNQRRQKPRILVAGIGNIFLGAEAVGAVDGTLVEGALAGIRPIAHHSFVVSPVSGGVYKITTNAKGQFHFRGRPGVYYPVDSSGFDAHSGLQPFRVVAGKTTHVVVSSVDTSAAWQASANS